MNCGAVPKRSAMYGTSGIRMPNPSVSMTQNENSTASCRDNRLVSGHYRGDIGARLCGSRQRIARGMDDEVRKVVVIPGGIAPLWRAGAHDGDLQRRYDPEAIAA